ncbi:DMT family transporter [Thalassobacter stenotrophicus]|uniref:Carboxylate/amino acid/amine transporter n=2 Tax=Thalassobacter stenotrophicus TaxID=266809 RepID=A0A0P1F0D2_9RHOB|nr:DMT family transporter [Thalassobacter stenotrophicus]PVZ48125.1 EamA/RhaT family transporter [Thalassobacter stenotrophicus]CUH61001.1 carboxylate/amino acid/amine transporter [Thalassobacter stenotrophicus]SHI54566.1 EamA domain-containing membrane protein RarD [Thalassobacter stenotrophicus DSM 16310]
MTHLPAPSLDRPMLGIAFMLGFCLMAPLGDGMVKALAGTFPILMLVFVRTTTQTVLLAPLVARNLASLHLSSRLWRLTLLRACLYILGIWAMFASLTYLPLADAIAIAFVMPFILLLLGHFVLGEEVGPHRMGACAVGFMGTLMVIQPSFANVGWPAMLPLVVAVVFALFMLVTRQISKEIDPITLQAINGAQASVLVGAAVLLTGAQSTWPIPQGADILWLFALGALGTLGHLCMTWSLRLAPASTLAPMQYLEIPVATIIGFAAFGDLPNGLAAVGICVTVLTGLYIILRENKGRSA